MIVHTARSRQVFFRRYDVKRRKKQWFLLGAAVLVMILAGLFIAVYQQPEAEIISYVKSIEGQKPDSEQQEVISAYLNSSDTYDCAYYFVSGFQELSRGNYQNAEKLFGTAEKKLDECNNDFVRIYTYIFLNEALYKQGETEELAENAENALKYMALSGEYRNNMDLCWRAVSVLRDNQKNISRGSRMLEEYAENTRGLTKESVIRLYGNIGQMYSLTGSYSSALYYYWNGLDKLKSSFFVPDSSSYESKFWAVIGDIAFVLEQYPLAVKYYDQALEAAEACRENQEVISVNCLSLINKSSSYLELGKTAEAEKSLKLLDQLIPDLASDEKDDIEILRNNQYALLAIYEGKPDTAEEKLQKAEELLKTDSVEYSLDKDVYLEYTRAQLYKSRKQYQKALELYSQLEKSSLEQGLDLEKDIYFDVAEIYKQTKDIDNYIKYHEKYAAAIQRENRSLSSEYIDYSQDLYEFTLYRKKEYMRNFLIFLAGILVLIVLGTVGVFLIKWRKKSFLDHLTKLYNRAYLHEYINKNRKKLMNKSISVIMLDIDFFKQYNDFYGHIQGDNGLKAVAAILQDSVRREDLVVRYGGEEMLILIAGSTSRLAEKIACRIQENLAKAQIPHAKSQIAEFLTVSMGIYTTEYTGEDISSIIECADKALYQAKSEGRNQYKQYKRNSISHGITS